MQVTVTTRSPLEASCPLLAIPLAQLDPEHWRLPARVGALDRELGEPIAGALGRGDFRGRRGESLMLYPSQGEVARLLLVGLGSEAEIDAGAVREAAGVAAGAARRVGAEALGLISPSVRRLRAPAQAQALAEGLLLGSYAFDRYVTSADEPKEPAGRARIHLEKGADTRQARSALQRGMVLAESQNLARDLSNEPPNRMTPAALARAAEKMAREVGLRCRVLGPAELARHKMGAMLAVAQGSHNAPRLIVLEHNAPARGRAAKGAKRRAARRPTICLVGKGVCFDSGGLSLKPASSMVKMKHDMSGGAAVIGALRAVALQKLPLHVVGIIGAVENMPSGHAYRVDDILTSASGKTIEVSNTDAEGRLVLADALHFAQKEFQPQALVDLATLTGACGIALGPWAAAVVSAHDGLTDAIVAAGESTGERFWPLPLWEVHREHMRSKIADVRQTGGRDAGTVTAAAFLGHFVDRALPWAHLDIASVADTDNPGPIQPHGATGFGVRALLALLGDWKRIRLS